MDYQRVVDDLRSFVLSNDQRLTPSVTQLAEDYVQVCNEANLRLRRCEEYLKQGMRSEAVQLAESQPALLDLVQVIDFPERAAWDDLAATYNLPAAPRLLLESAQALNRAYSEVQPLDKLLRRHRLLALSGACLGERLRLVRQIASRDPNNSIWPEDIREFESARFRQFPGEMDAALARGDLAAVVKLMQEYEQEPWLETPPMNVIQMASGKAMDHVGARLLQAYQDRNEALARQLREYWNYFARYAGKSQGGKKGNANKALQWLQQLDGKNAKLADMQNRVKALEEALTDGASLQEIDMMYHDLRNLGYGLPANLESRYQARRRIVKGSEGYLRRERIILASVIVAGIVALVMVFTFLRR